MRSVFAKGAVAVSVAALLLTGCGGSEPGGGGGGGGDKETRGPITFATGKDTTGKLQGILDLWNKDHPDEQVKLLELSESADEQRNAMVQNFQAGTGTYDVVNADVIWTAEFAAREWLEELGDKAAPEGIIPATVETGKFEDKIYAAPWTSDGGMLYYRKDLVKTPPKTWDELKQACAIAEQNNMDCYAGQFKQYEGLTVNASEAINSAGGVIMENSGKEVAVDSQEARDGLQFLVDGFKNGEIPKEAITYQEEEGRRAFQAGKLLFLRNWPYVYNLAREEGPDSKIVGKFDVAPLPGPDGVGASSLGGHNLALSTDSKNKATARDWIAFMQSEETQRAIAKDMGLAPVIESLYDDPELIKTQPYLPVLKESILNAQVRPVTPNYNQVSLAIQKEAYAALQGTKTVDQAIKDLAGELEEAAKRS